MRFNTNLSGRSARLLGGHGGLEVLGRRLVLVHGPALRVDESNADSLGRRRLDRCSPTMYIHRMVRTQLYLDEAIHARLRDLAHKQKRTVSELVREALLRAYGAGESDERHQTLKAIRGLWQDREDINSREYVRRLRSDTRRKKKSPR